MFIWFHRTLCERIISTIVVIVWQERLLATPDGRWRGVWRTGHDSWKSQDAIESKRTSGVERMLSFLPVGSDERPLFRRRSTSPTSYTWQGMWQSSVFDVILRRWQQKQSNIYVVDRLVPWWPFWLPCLSSRTRPTDGQWRQTFHLSVSFLTDDKWRDKTFTHVQWLLLSTEFAKCRWWWPWSYEPNRGKHFSLSGVISNSILHDMEFN